MDNALRNELGLVYKRLESLPRILQNGERQNLANISQERIRLQKYVSQLEQSIKGGKEQNPSDLRELDKLRKLNVALKSVQDILELVDAQKRSAAKKLNQIL